MWLCGRARWGGLRTETPDWRLNPPPICRQSWPGRVSPEGLRMGRSLSRGSVSCKRGLSKGQEELSRGSHTRLFSQIYRSRADREDEGSKEHNSGRNSSIFSTFTITRFLKGLHNGEFSLPEFYDSFLKIRFRLNILGKNMT